MSPEEVKEIRDGLGLSQAALGQTLRLGPNGKRTVARWEAGGTIPGPVQLALEALRDGWRPGFGHWSEARELNRVLDEMTEVVTGARQRVGIASA